MFISTGNATQPEAKLRNRTETESAGITGPSTLSQMGLETKVPKWYEGRLVLENSLFLIFMYKCVLMYVCELHAWLWIMSDLLELANESLHVGARNQTQALSKSNKCP